MPLLAIPCDLPKRFEFTKTAGKQRGAVGGLLRLNEHVLLCFMTCCAAYTQTLRSLLSHRPTHSKWGLQRSRELLQRLSNPHKRMRLLQVAGTNGKGSVCAMLQAMLQQGGVITGCFTSPHLSCIRERICVNGHMVKEKAFCQLYNHVEQAARGMAEPPTFFEYLFAMALLHFARAGAQVAILEVGLGGRLDATTAVAPQVCGITTIARDHTRLLGHTLSGIAREKAGICKLNVPVIVAPQLPETFAVLQQHASAVGAPLIRVGRHIRVMHWGDGIAVFQENRLLLPPTRLALKGKHQWNNAAVAVGMLQQANLASNPQTRRCALEQMHWPGRYEWINTPLRGVCPFASHTRRLSGVTGALGNKSTQCLSKLSGVTEALGSKGTQCPVLLDGAHNPNGLMALAQCLKEDSRLQNKPLFAVVGLSQGHDENTFARVWRQYMPPMQTVYATQGSTGHFTCALNTLTTAKLLRQAGVRNVVPVARVSAALHHARIQARRCERGCILVTGSLYVVGQARSLLLGAPTDPIIIPGAMPAPAHR